MLASPTPLVAETMVIQPAPDVAVQVPQAASTTSVRLTIPPLPSKFMV